MSSWSTELFEEFRELVHHHAGLQFSPERTSSLIAAVERSAAQAGFPAPHDYLQALRSGHAKLGPLIDACTVGETYFFREPHQFAMIEHEVLPERAVRNTGTLRVWSAGCSSGEEAYSLAILLQELGLGERATVLASDLSSAALRKAEAGVYGEWALRSSEGFRARRHLDPTGNPGLYRVQPALRRRVSFHRHNLMQREEHGLAFGEFDLVLCRNVLIYLDAAAVRAVAQNLYDALAEGGWLFTASSDPPLGELAPFARVVTRHGIYYRRLRGAERRIDRSDVGRSSSPPAVEVRRAQPSVARLALRTERPPIADTSAQHDASTSSPAPPPVVTQAEDDLVRLTLAELEALLSRGRRADAEHYAATQASAHPLRAELQYLHALTLLERGDERAARNALKRAVYLDGRLIAAHLALALLALQTRNERAALRGFKTVERLSATLPPEAPVLLAGGLLPTELVGLARRHVEQLESDLSLPPDIPGSHA